MDIQSLIIWNYSFPYLMGIAVFYFFLADGFNIMFDQFKIWSVIHKPVKILSSVTWPVSSVLLLLLGFIVFVSEILIKVFARKKVERRD